jgi:hypothetical protein
MGGDNAAAGRPGVPTAAVPTSEAAPPTHTAAAVVANRSDAAGVAPTPEAEASMPDGPPAGEVVDDEAVTAEPRPPRSGAPASSGTRPAIDPSSGPTPVRVVDPSVAPEPAPPPGRPVAPMMQEQLAQAELRRLGASTTRLGLDIATEQLGTIRVNAVDRGGDLQLNLSSDRSATRHLLTNELSSLRSELADGASVHVDVGERGRHPSRSATGAGDQVDDAVVPAGADVPSSPSDQSSGPDQGRLDLRM